MHSASKSTATTISETSINYNEHLSCDESSYYFNAAYTSVPYPGECAPLGRRMELRGEAVRVRCSKFESSFMQQFDVLFEFRHF
ncbi:hypothetical protein T11_17849, partial [Trichinella zimbabwensis]